jgi:hypothetical protein
VGKHTDALKPFDEFRAPWETADGSEAEIDKPKLKRYIYGLATDKAKAQDAREDAVESVKTIEADLEAAKKEAASANGEEATKKIARLEKDLAEAKATVTTLEKDKEVSELRAEVLEGVDPKHAKHVKGETREELEKSLAEIREDFGIKAPDDDGDGDGDDDDAAERAARTRPRPNLRNPADSKPNDGSDEIDFDKVADDILGTSIFR